LLHERGATAQWLAGATAGDRIGFTGVRTEFVDTAEAEAHLLIGDRSSLPAIATISDSLSHTKRTVIVAIGGDDDRSALELPAAVETTLVDDPTALIDAVTEFSGIDARTQVWIGAEAGVVRQIRRDVLGREPMSRDALHASAYWKNGLDWEETF